MKTPLKLSLIALLILWIASTAAAQDTGDDETVCIPTPPDALGPYFIEDAPETLTLYPDDAPGDRLLVQGTVYLGDCDTPLADAVVEVWQADSLGEYDFSDDFIGRGMVVTDENGYYEYITIVPAEYEPRPPHIHYRITHPDHDIELVTQLYFEESFPGAGSHPQVTALEDFDLNAFITDRLAAGADENELDEDAIAALYDDVLYVATFDIVLAP